MEPPAHPHPVPRHRSLHAAYALVVFVLILTGLPIHLPELRATLLGGHGRALATAHEWAGLAMIALPLAAARAPGPMLAGLRALSRRTDARRFHAIYLWFTLVSGILFVVTGVVLWWQAVLPDLFVDPSRTLHVALTIALLAVLPVHVVVVRHKLRAPFVRGTTPDPEESPC